MDLAKARCGPQFQEVPTTSLEPTDDGVRKFRPGLLLMLSVLGLIVLVGGLFFVVRTRQEKPEKTNPAEPSVVVAIPKEVIEPPKPVVPPDHPLSGKRRIFLADGCAYRYQELTFERNLAAEGQHAHPVVTIEKNDPTVWEFRAVEGKMHVYRIFCADERYPEQLGMELTYTRVIDDPFIGDPAPTDEVVPYITIRDDDPCEWKVHKRPSGDGIDFKDQYELFCLSGSAPFAGEALSWTSEHEELKYDAVVATIGENGIPAWWILGENESPKIPRRASHVIITPRDVETDNLEKAKGHLADEGRSIFKIEIESGDDSFTREATEVSFGKLVKSLRGNDPVVKHPAFREALQIPDDPLALIKRLEEMAHGENGLFPMVVPLNMTLHAHGIDELSFEDTEFTWVNTWEDLDDLQDYLDESDQSDGRVFIGEKFIYLFVHWEP